MNEIEIILPKPHKAQQQVVNSKARFKVLCCGRRFGKSLIAMILAIRDMLEGKKVAYVTPEYGLAKDFFKEFTLKLPNQIIQTSNKSELYIELITGGSIKFFSGEAIENFRGRKYHKVIIDEAAFVNDLENAWNQTIRPTLTDYKGDAIFISTPKGKRFFDSLYQRGLNNEPGYESFHFTSYDNPYIAKTEIDEAKSTLPASVFNQEYLAIPMEDANNPFGINNIKQNIITQLSGNESVVYGIDIAKYNDWTAIVGLDENGHQSYFDRFRLSWELTKERIIQLPSNGIKIIDATGVGDVLYESLAMDISNLEPFKFTGESKPKIIYELIKDVESGNIKYNQVIADEMSVYEFKYSSTGHLKFEAASGYHDDTIAALAMANHYRKQHIQVNNWKLTLV